LARYLGSFGIVAAVLFVTADIVGSVLTPDYSMTADAISELVERGAPFKHVVDPLLAAYHAALIPFAAGLHFAIGGPKQPATGPLLLGGAGAAGVLLTVFFPCDPGCEPFITLPGTLHILIAIPMGFSILAAIWAFSRRMARVSEWSRYSSYSRFTAIVGLALAGGTVAFAETDVVGILERVLTVSYLQWYVVIGAEARRPT
jgi:hypothetical protein